MSKSKKTRNGGEWTEARFISFVKGALRSASMRWKPKTDTRKKARVARGQYLCAGYKREPHVEPASRNRQNNIFVDHIVPIVDPMVGFVDWNAFINGLFCEEDNLQVLCKACHTHKTNDEKELRKVDRTTESSD